VLSVLAVTGTASAAVPDLRGVQVHSLWWDSSQAEMYRELDLARDAHANVIRLDVVWGSLETGGKGKYSRWYLHRLDRLIQGASARGMKVIVTLWSTPCWASSAPAGVKQDCAGHWWARGVGAYPPTDPRDYGDIAGFITARYGTKLAALEVWNEPNLDSDQFWETADKAGDYAKLLKAAYPRAKAGNAAVPVLAGAMAFADRPFLDALEANGIKGFHDGISIHPYNEWRHPADRWRADSKKYTLVPGIEAIRQGQEAARDVKPIWATEFGWTTGTGSGWHVTESQQAEFIGASFSVLGRMPYLKAAVVYNLREKGDDPSSPEDNFGLVQRDFRPKPAYDALRRSLAGRAQVQPAVTLRLRNRGRFSYAHGTGPKRGRVWLSLARCKRVRPRRITVKVSRRGGFRRRLGVTKRLAGCRVSVRIRHRGSVAATAGEGDGASIVLHRPTRERRAGPRYALGAYKKSELPAARTFPRNGTSPPHRPRRERNAVGNRGTERVSAVG
jgi:hypothetical protein